MKRPTVTIGIPAFNEYDNLRRLLPALISQEQKRYTLERIIIISDGSTDATHTLRGRLPKLIRVISEKNRRGKPARINEIFAKSKSDFVVILDADIKILGRTVLDNLLSDRPHANSVLIAGMTRPLAPTNAIGSVALAGIQIWNTARTLAPDTQLYFADGSIRAFSKGIYKHMTFPDTSADDAYSYIICKKNGWTFSYKKQAIVYNRLPTTLRDYYFQQRRYLTSPDIQQGNFPGYTISKFFTIAPGHKGMAVLMNLVRNPFWTVLYLLFILFIKGDLKLRRELYTSKWTILPTTKSANI